MQSDLGLHDLLFKACQAENIGALCHYGTNQLMRLQNYKSTSPFLLDCFE